VQEASAGLLGWAQAGPLLDYTLADNLPVLSHASTREVHVEGHVETQMIYPSDVVAAHSVLDPVLVVQALGNYERFYNMVPGTATVAQVQSSSAMLFGWAMSGHQSDVDNDFDHMQVTQTCTGANSSTYVPFTQTYTGASSSTDVPVMQAYTGASSSSDAHDTHRRCRRCSACSV
jgi:hypothetical protein